MSQKLVPPPREAKTFGVGSCLAEEARVYYSHLSSMDHMGRVSDLFAALLKKHQPNPLKIRMLSALTGFQAYFVRSAIESGSQSVLMECGHDSGFAAIGVSFVYPGFGKDQLAGLPERIRANAPENTFEKILFSCADIADKCYFRIQPQDKKIEIVSVFAFSSKDLSLNAPISQKLSFILIGGEKAPPQLAVKEYKELGDTDFTKLLEQKNPKDQILAPTNGEFIAKSVKIDDFKKIIEDDAKKNDFSASFSAEPLKRNNQKFVFKATAADEEVYEALPEAKETDEQLEENVAGLEDVMSAVRGQTVDVVAKATNKDDAKKAVDSMFKELIGEKSKLVETARKVNHLLKKKALEFRMKERGWAEEIRRKEEEIKQKQSAYNHLKELLSKANVQNEQLNRQVTVSNNDAVYKEKFETTRAELAEAKRDLTLSQRKVAEVSKQLADAQAVNKNTGGQDKLVAELNQKVAQSTRQLEEYKRVNQQIMGKVAELEKKRGSGNSQLEEVKSRLAKATQLAQDKGKEADRNKARIIELQNEKDRLMKELADARKAMASRSSAAQVAPAAVAPKKPKAA